MTPDETPATLAERLERGRRRRFVGRAAELELFRAALDASDEAFAVLFVHGPGGVGKSALLAEYARMARAVGRRPVSVDGHEVTPTPAGFRAALAESLGVPADGEVADVLRAGTHVVLVDTFERLAPMKGWVRDRFLPVLPAGVVVVVGGRRPPTPDWLADAAWRDLLRVVSLRNLPPDGTREYLELEGLPAAVHAQVVALTHGHPLALSLLVDALRRSGDPGRVPGSFADAPDLVAALLARIVDEAPGPRPLAALHVCGHAAFTTEGLLRAVLGGDDAPELFAWLRDLSFVDETARGCDLMTWPATCSTPTWPGATPTRLPPCTGGCGATSSTRCGPRPTRRPGTVRSPTSCSWCATIPSPAPTGTGTRSATPTPTG